MKNQIFKVRDNFSSRFALSATVLGDDGESGSEVLHRWSKSRLKVIQNPFQMLADGLRSDSKLRLRGLRDALVADGQDPAYPDWVVSTHQSEGWVEEAVARDRRRAERPINPRLRQTQHVQHAP